MPAVVVALRARLVSAAVAPLLDEAGLTGRVHSVYHHAVNLLAGGHLITVALPAAGAMPNGLVLAGDEPLDRLGLAPGMAIEGDCRALRVPEVGVSIDFSGAHVWSPQLATPVLSPRASVVVGNLGLALRLAAEQAPEHGFGPLLGWLTSHEGAGILTGAQFSSTARRPRGGQWRQDDMPVSDITGLPLLCRVALPSIQTVAGALRPRDEERAAAAAASLVGLGPGLTPSGDDFLAGLCAALFATNDPLATSFAAGCAEAARGKTTLVAETLMFYAARGEFSSHLHDLLRALLADDRSGLASRVSETLAWGSSSGTDCLLGVLVGLAATYPPASRPGERGPAAGLQRGTVI